MNCKSFRVPTGVSPRGRQPIAGASKTCWFHLDQAHPAIFLKLAILAILLRSNPEWRMKAVSAKDAKYNFGRMIDMARAEPVVSEKHGRPVVVVVAVEEFERLQKITQNLAGKLEGK
jgi:prevent-host-death family protein